jgi:hypothetical protein
MTVIQAGILRNGSLNDILWNSKEMSEKRKEKKVSPTGRHLVSVTRDKIINMKGSYPPYKRSSLAWALLLQRQN